jgi:hypothetical protein
MLDQIDLHILDVLQRHGRISNQELADEQHKTKVCWTIHTKRWKEALFAALH